jgi:hypothetical protein
LLVAFCAAAVFLGARRASADVNPLQFAKDLGQFCASPTRVVGSPGYEQACNYLQSEIAKLPNVQLRVHGYPLLVPVTHSATLDLGGGRVEKVYPFWPAQVRVCSTPPDGIRGKLVYAGECRYEQIRPRSLYGQIAVVEASAQARWTEGFYVGARAVLVLGTSQTTWADLQSHDLRIPVNLPRFFVPDGKLADELRKGLFTADAKLTADVQWERKLARNYYALVGAAHDPQAAKDATSPAALAFSVSLESTSLVPDLSPGASQAVQAACGLSMLRQLNARPWQRPVLIVFEGADGIQFLGTRNMFLALGTPPVKWQSEIAMLGAQIASAERDVARARAAVSAPQAISITDDRELIDRIVKIVETDLAIEQDELFRLRSDAASAGQKREIARLEERQIHLNRLKYAFQQTPDELSTPELKDGAQEYLGRAIARLGGARNAEGLIQQDQARRTELNQRIELYHWLADSLGRQREPGRKQTDARLIELLVGLDLSDRGSAVGPMFLGYFQRASSMGQIQEFREWFAQMDRGHAAGTRGTEWWGPIKRVINFDPLSQTRAPSTFLAAPLPIASELAAAFATPGLSMVTLHDLRLRRDTPNDVIDAIDLPPILRQLAGVCELFEHASAYPRFHGPIELKRL